MKVMVFDVGGTEIKYSVMDEGLNRTDAGSVPTPQDTQKHFLDTLYDLYSPHRDEVSGIAMALPGFVDTHTGFVSNGGALLYNTGTQVGQLVRERCGCPVTLENDGKAAALAELQAGALQGCCNAAVFIIGTGVGGGISKQPLLLDSLRRVYAGLFASRGDSPYMIGLPRTEIVPCHFSSEANQVGALYACLHTVGRTD